MIPRSIALRTLRLLSTTSPTRTLWTLTSRPQPSQLRSASHSPPSLLRYLATKSPADLKIEEITELYSTAQDEFEIAMEETEKVSVYAEEDRKAAREELEKVKEAFRVVVEGEDKELGEEVKRRIGQRVRELEAGVGRMEEMALEQD